MTNDKAQMTKEIQSTKAEVDRGFYAENARRADLLVEANRWIGTRFHGHARVLGVGVDCVQLAGALYIATGFLREFEPGWYPIDGGHHDEQSRVIEWVEKSGCFARIGKEAPMAGDLIVMKLGRVEHHVGVALGGGMMVHVMFKASVTVETLGRFLKNVTAVYRPLRAGGEGAAGLQHVRD